MAKHFYLYYSIIVTLFIALVITVFISACSHNKTKQKSLHPILPSQCLDPSGKFTPVKNIITKTSYQEKAKTYSPIKSQNGIIKSDFNADHHPDFIFIEQLSHSSKKPRLVLCISTEKGYQRKLPPFAIHSNTKADFQSIHERIEWTKKQLILSSFKHEHNWGSDDEINYYRYNTQRKDFILQKRELLSSSGDGMRSNTHKIYNLESLLFQDNLQCGHVEEGCKPYQRKGKMILPRIKPSLFQPSKMYTRLKLES